ncbi:MAG: methylated-DNA--[protein]-cysteine S-methyltransferase [Prosthecobacter sp.]|nr:methylated-DNA--[protein]-cysteine S-methyltransferase [Prosthecobacter sp.]
MIKNFKRREMFEEGIRRHEGKMGEEIRFVMGPSSLGLVLVASSQKGIVAILLGGGRKQLVEELQQDFPQAHLVRENGSCEDVVPRVIECIEDPARDLDLPLDMRGTDFQKRVWRAVREIPMGQTTTYSEIASKIGAPKAIRAVGSACSKSKFAVVIPCHRVLHKDGSLCGGSWGSDTQRMLIDREVGTEGQKRLASGGRNRSSQRRGI